MQGVRPPNLHHGTPDCYSDSDALRQHAHPGPSRLALRGDRAGAGARTGGSTCPEHFPRLYLSDFGAAGGAGGGGRRPAGPLLRGRPPGGLARRDLPRGLRLPDPAARGAPRAPSVLELFHGPTAAFKDVGARFLAAAPRAARAPSASAPLTILVATSGDTGGAVAAAFHGRPGIRVVVLFPKGRVSARQEKQLTAWGGNVRALAVRGDFDDCQRMVKEALADAELQRAAVEALLREQHQPGAAPPADGLLRRPRPSRTCASTAWRPASSSPPETWGTPSPASGRSAWGCPIREVVLATNANPRHLRLPRRPASGSPRPTVATLATAMDVGEPQQLRAARPPLRRAGARARRRLRAFRVDDEEIRARDPRRPRALGRGLGPPHRHRRRRARAPRQPRLDPGLHRPPRQVRVGGGAARRPRGARAPRARRLCSATPAPPPRSSPRWRRWRSG